MGGVVMIADHPIPADLQHMSARRLMGALGIEPSPQDLSPVSSESLAASIAELVATVGAS